MFYVYGFEGCQYCQKAVDLLNKFNKSFVYYDIKDPAQKDKLAFLKASGYTTVPQIFTSDLYIGGYTDLAQSLELGLL